MAADIMHRQRGPVKARVQSSSSKVGDTRPGKATLKGLIRMSDKYRSLSLRARAVFDALLERAGGFKPDQAGNELMHCWPGRKYLAEDVGRSVDFVDRGLAELRKAGLVVSANRGGRCGKQNYYTLFVPKEIVESMNAEAVERASSPQVCGLQGRESAGSNAAELRHSLEPDSVKQEKRTTTTEAHHTQTARAASTNAGHGGGGDFLSNDEMQRAKAKLREHGVGMSDQAIENMLRAGNITAAIADAAWHAVPESANDQAAVLVSMLRRPDVVDRLRAKTVEESKLIAVTNERAAFARLSEDERRFWCDRARKHWPNLGNAESRPDHDPVIQGAAFKVYRMSDKRNIVETITEAVERAKTSREYYRLNGKDPIADRITQAIENVEAVANDPGFITLAVEVITIANAGERFKALAKLARFWTGEVESVESTEGVASC